MPSKHKSNDAGNSNMSKRSHNVLSLNENKYLITVQEAILRDHIHITFSTVYCYNCSILLVVVDLLLCLIDKLKFIIDVHSKYSILGFSTMHGFGHPQEVLESIPCR